MKLLGFRVTEDLNGADQFGFGYVQTTMKDGARWTTAKAYLRNRRPNLTVLLSARVEKIMVEKADDAYYSGGHVARGVVYRRFKRRDAVYARKEVILSAGAIASPQLLMVSGIGPRDHLSELGRDSQ